MTTNQLHVQHSSQHTNEMNHSNCTRPLTQPLVCMCVCMYVHTYHTHDTHNTDTTHTQHTHTHNIHTHIHAHTHTYTHTHSHHTHTYIHTHIIFYNPLIGQYDINDTGTRALPHSHVSSFKTVLKRNEMFTPQEVPVIQAVL